MFRDKIGIKARKERTREDGGKKKNVVRAERGRRSKQRKTGYEAMRVSERAA